MMQARDRHRIIERCESMSAALKEIDKPAFSWCLGELTTLARYTAELKKHEEVAQELPEEWHRVSAAQVTMGSLFTSPQAVSRFLAEQRQIAQPSRDLAERALQDPWCYSLFSAEVELGDDLWECVDFAEGARFLLYSAAVTTLMREGSRLFLGLLFSNGSCRQTFGPVHYFRGFRPPDFVYFASCVEPQFFRQRGLAATIARRPAPFLLLSRWTEIPPVAYRGTPVEVWFDERQATELPPLAKPDRFEVDVRGRITRCLLGGADPDAPPFFTEAAVYFDAGKHRLIARAMSEQRYRALLKHAGPALGLSPQPLWRPSINMVMAAEELLGRKMPGWDYVERFEPPGPTEEPREIQALNALLHDISRRENAGLSYSLEDLAALNEVSIEEARRALDIFRDAQAVPGTQMPGGLEAFTPPPPDVRSDFRLRLETSPLFELEVSPETARVFVHAAREAASASPVGGRRGRLRALVADGVVGPRELPRFLEDEFFRLFRAADVTLLNYTLYLLLRCGRSEQRVSDYAIEVAKTFGQTLDDEGRSDLVPTFARFCTHVLEPLCLLNVRSSARSATAGEAGPRMQTTPLFRRWIRLGSYWEEPEG